MMSDPIVDRIKVFFKALEDTREGSELMKLHDHTYQFQVTDAFPPSFFCVSFEGGKVNFGEGEIKNASIRNVTRVEAPTETYVDLIEGRLRPSEAWLKQKWWVSGQMSKRPLHGFIMRLIRTGQDLRIQA